MCYVALNNFRCGHEQKELLHDCSFLNCIPQVNTFDLPYYCGHCHVPVIEPLYGFDIPDSDICYEGYLNNTFEHVLNPNPTNSHVDVSLIDPQLLENGDTAFCPEMSSMMFPQWMNYSFDVDINDQKFPDINDTADSETPVQSDYPALPELSDWNPWLETSNITGNGGDPAKNQKWQVNTDIHKMLMRNYVTPAPFPDSELFFDVSSPASSPLASKRYRVRELSPTPGAREFESYMEAADTLACDLSWCDGPLPDCLEDQRTSPLLSPISPPDFLRDCPELPDAETLGISKPPRIDPHQSTIINKKKDEIKDEGKEGFLEGESISDFEVKLPSNPIIPRSSGSRSKRRRKPFRLTVPKYGIKRGSRQTRTN